MGYDSPATAAIFFAAASIGATLQQPTRRARIRVGSTSFFLLALAALSRALW